MRRISEFISEGMHKFLVNKKSVGNALEMHEGDFNCLLSYWDSGAMGSVNLGCNAYSCDGDEMTVRFDRITHATLDEYRKRRAEVSIRSTEKTLARGRRMLDASIESEDESGVTVVMKFKIVEENI